MGQVLPLYVLVLGCLTYLSSGGDYMYITNQSSTNPASFYIGGITGTLCVLYLSKAIVKLPFVSYIGKYSIMILLTHLLVLAVLSSVVKRFITDTDAAYLITICITLVCYLAIIPLMRKFLPHVTAQKDVFKMH